MTAAVAATAAVIPPVLRTLLTSVQVYFIADFIGKKEKFFFYFIYYADLGVNQRANLLGEATQSHSLQTAIKFNLIRVKLIFMGKKKKYIINIYLLQH